MNMRTGAFEKGRNTGFTYELNKLPHSSGGFGTHTDIILPGADEPQGPEAFLVEQPPASILGAHFHAVSQFQVIVAGSGALGKHSLEPVHVHYSNRHTGY